jgi:HSP20 family molecular chaperone IbpA
MPFLQPSYLGPESTFFQLLSELNQPTHITASRPNHRQAGTFIPRFDITEIFDAYELYGELPGFTQDDLSIEFSDAQTLVVKGKTQRASSTEAVQAEKPTNDKGKGKEVDTSSGKSHAATVEDDYDDVDTPDATRSTATTGNQSQTAESSASKPKLWFAERRVGEFARSFSFLQRIEQDFVSADLNNGILHIVVPKSQKSRKVTVTVD